MQAELFDDAFDTAGADRQAGLGDFLSDDVGRGIRVEEAMTNNLAHDFVGATRTGFGTPFATDEGLGALGVKELAELEIALLAEPELGCGLRGSQALAIAFEEHGEFDRAFVLGGDRQNASGADKGMAIQVEVQHRNLEQKKRVPPGYSG